jgi:hypothetical protein
MIDTLRSFRVPRPVDFVRLAGCLLVGLVLVSCQTDDDDDAAIPDEAPAAPLEVGAAQVDITPEIPVILGGYGMVFLSDRFCRWSEGVHDPIYATAVAIDDRKGQTIVQIALDTIGILEDDVHEIQNGIAMRTGVDPTRVIVSASHSHGSPDTVGIYGVILPPRTGRVDEFIAQMIEGAVEAGSSAYETRRPATARAATGWEPNYHHNFNAENDPEAMLDSTITVVGFFDEDGETIATMTNWGCHPTVLPPENLLISADYIGGFYDRMAEELPGVHLFLNGNMGASVRPQNVFDPFEDPEGQSWGDFDDAAAVGGGVAETALGLLDRAVPIRVDGIQVLLGTVSYALRNPMFALMGRLGVIAHDMPEFGEAYPLPMIAYRMGPVLVGTVPGELPPNVGLAVRGIMDGEFEMVVNIGQDWAGYLLTEAQWRDLGYIDYSFLSAGPGGGQAIQETYRRLFDPASEF